MFFPHIPPDRQPPMRVKKYGVEPVEKIDPEVDLQEEDLKSETDLDNSENEFENIMKEVDKAEEEACEANKATVIWPPQDEPSDCVIF